MDSTVEVKMERPVPINLLTGIRFWLSLYVVLFHFALQFFVTSATPVQSFMSAGYSAVSMFFALSGYVLAYNHFDGRPINLRRFWIARIARIAPAFLIAEVICVVYLLFATHRLPGWHVILRELSISLLFLEGWVFPFLKVSAVNAPAWSLSCEIFFYMLFPLCAIPISRLGKPALRVLCGVLIVLSLAAPLIYLATTPDGVPVAGLTARALAFPASPAVTAAREALWHEVYGVLFYVPIFHLPVFLLGAALGRYRRVFLAHAPLRTNLHRTAFLAMTVALFFVLFFSAGFPQLLLQVSIIGVLFAFCMLFAESAPKVGIRFLEWKPILLLGEASYAMYILQAPLGLAWDTIGRHWKPRGISAIESTIIFVALLIVFSAAVFEWVERPVRLHIRKFAYGAKPAA